MLRSLESGVSGMQQFQQEMDVIGNNVANVNTTGFKSSRANFVDTFSQSLAGGSSGNMQVGSGVATSTVSNLFTQGTINETGAPSNLAINGQGFFVVKNTADSAQFATRDGSFKVDTDGYLVTAEGFRVQGYSDSTLTTVGDIKIDAGANAATVKVNSYRIASDGKIYVTPSDNTGETIRGQVLLQNYLNPQALVKEGNNLYSNLTNAGPLAALGAPKASGLGSIQQGSLEMSNVDLTSEFSMLITNQRAFQASSRIITTSDELLQEIINLKR